MSKYLPALIVGAMVAIAAFAADVWNVGVASVDTSGNATFAGSVTAGGVSTGTTVFASAAVRTPKSYLTTNGVNVGWFEVVDITNLVFIANGVTNRLDANGIAVAN